MAEKSLPKVEEILTDPKYAEQKAFLKGLILGIAKEARDEGKGKKKKETSVNIFDALFGSGEPADDDED